MHHNHSIATSDAGDVVVHERHLVLGVHVFSRQNNRPVSPTCVDQRIERGVRIGTWCLALRRTRRVHRDFPQEWMETPL